MFPADLDRRACWVSTINRMNWQPTEHSWLCSSDLISGAKCDDPFYPDFVHSVFAHTVSPLKRKQILTVRAPVSLRNVTCQEVQEGQGYKTDNTTLYIYRTLPNQ